MKTAIFPVPHVLKVAYMIFQHPNMNRTYRPVAAWDACEVESWN